MVVDELVLEEVLELVLLLVEELVLLEVLEEVLELVLEDVELEVLLDVLELELEEVELDELLVVEELVVPPLIGKITILSIAISPCQPPAATARKRTCVLLLLKFPTAAPSQVAPFELCC